MAEAKTDPHASKVAKLEKRIDVLESVIRANGMTMPGEGHDRSEDDGE